MAYRISRKDLDAAIANLNKEFGKTGEWDDDGSFLLYKDIAGYKLERVCVTKSGTGARNVSAYGMTAKEMMTFLDGMSAAIEEAKATKA